MSQNDSQISRLDPDVNIRTSPPLVDAVWHVWPSVTMRRSAPRCLRRSPRCSTPTKPCGARATGVRTPARSPRDSTAPKPLPGPVAGGSSHKTITVARSRTGALSYVPRRPSPNCSQHGAQSPRCPARHLEPVPHCAPATTSAQSLAYAHKLRTEPDHTQVWVTRRDFNPLASRVTGFSW